MRVILRRPVPAALLALALCAGLGACGGGTVVLGTTAPTAVAPPTAAPTTAGSSTAPVASATPSTALSTTLSTTIAPSTAPPTTGLLEPSSTIAEPGTVLALDLLLTITVANENGAGYDRDLFPHWLDLDGNGCSAREDVLIAESLTPAQVDPFGCKVVEGDWVSAYDGEETTTPSEFDIDHVIPLKEAWDSGAWNWSPAARTAFANDLTDDRTLIAVSASSNRSKGDKDPSNWVPPLARDLCRYLGDWVSIKARWNLTMDQSESGRIRNLLTSDCPGLRIRTAAAPPVTVPGPSTSGATPTTDPVGSTGDAGGEVYYANCTAARAAGAAPIYRGEPGYRSGLDRDNDGVACE